MARFLRPWCLLLVLIPATGRAQDSNFRPYLVGGRAQGLGGAFTALSDDGSGAYYNPGGLAFTHAPSISLSVNVYGLVGGSIKDSLGDGHDFNYRDLNVFPVATAGISKLKEADPASGEPKHTLFLSVLIPDGITNDDRDQLDLPGNAYFNSKSVQTLWIGGGYALRMGSLGFGPAPCSPSSPPGPTFRPLASSGRRACAGTSTITSGSASRSSPPRWVGVQGARSSGSRGAPAPPRQRLLRTSTISTRRRPSLSVFRRAWPGPMAPSRSPEI